MKHKRTGTFALLVVLVILTNCTRYTDNPDQGVVKLRDGIKNLVDGGTTEFRGATLPGEYYVFLSGYSQQRVFEGVSVAPGVRSELAAIAPPNEQYALARVRDDQVTEYTYFELYWPRDRAVQTSPGFVEPCPFVISGQLFKLTSERISSYETVIRLDAP